MRGRLKRFDGIGLTQSGGSEAGKICGSVYASRVSKKKKATKMVGRNKNRVVTGQGTRQPG